MSFDGAAMILAAGRGVRMRPLTRERAKPALPVLGRTLLERIVRELRSRGVRAFAANAHHGAASIEEALGRAARDGCEAGLFVEKELMGSGGALAAPRAFLAHGETFLLHNGDTLARPPLDELDRAARRPGFAAALLVRPGRVPPYGAVLVDRGTVTGLERRGDARGRPATYLGIAVLRRSVLEEVPDDRPSGLFEDLLLPLAARGERIAAVPYEGPWLEFTSPSSYREKLCRLVLGARPEGAVDLPGGVAPVRPVPEGAAYCGPEARLARGAALRGGVVAEDAATIAHGAIVEGSVLLEQAAVEPGGRAERAVLAPGAHVGAGATARDGVREPDEALARAGAAR